MISSLQGVVHNNHLETQKYAHDQLNESTLSETQTSEETIENISQSFRSAELHPKTQEALIRSHVEQKIIKEDSFFSSCISSGFESTSLEQIDFEEILEDLLSTPEELNGSCVDNPIVLDSEKLIPQPNSVSVLDASSSGSNAAFSIKMTEQNQQMLDEIRNYLKKTC